MKSKAATWLLRGLMVGTLLSTLSGCVIVPTPYGAAAVPIVPGPWWWHRHY